MSIRIRSTAYALPSTVEMVDAILERERARVDAALAPLSPSLRKRCMEGLGMERVRVCGAKQPYALAVDAAGAALAEAGVAARDLNLIIDFTTLPGQDGQYLSFAQRLSADLGAETSLNFSFRVGGCGGLHLALKTATALMKADPGLRTALLVAADSPPPGSRSLLPITVQSDAASAVVLQRGDGPGPEILGTEVLTLSHLHDVIRVCRGSDGREDLAIQVDSARIEAELMPIYYLNFYRLVHKLLSDAALPLSAVDHFVYSNVSRSDVEGFIRTIGVPEEKISTRGLAQYGHTFASDLVINYTDQRREGRFQPGQLLLFASAGIGFTWGVTLARA
jgi:3-oxoacyl-[acyl-carrier-protein] synthase-3